CSMRWIAMRSRVAPTVYSPSYSRSSAGSQDRCNAIAHNHEQRGEEIIMTQPTKILIADATGTVGRELAAQLSVRGTAVRALVRDSESANLPAGVESQAPQRAA